MVVLPPRPNELLVVPLDTEGRGILAHLGDVLEVLRDSLGLDQAASACSWDFDGHLEVDVSGPVKVLAVGGVDCSLVALLGHHNDAAVIVRFFLHKFKYK